MLSEQVCLEKEPECGQGLSSHDIHGDMSSPGSFRLSFASLRMPFSDGVKYTLLGISVSLFAIAALILTWQLYRYCKRKPKPNGKVKSYRSMDDKQAGNTIFEAADKESDIQKHDYKLFILNRDMSSPGSFRLSFASLRMPFSDGVKYTLLGISVSLFAIAALILTWQLYQYCKRKPKPNGKVKSYRSMDDKQAGNTIFEAADKESDIQKHDYKVQKLEDEIKKLSRCLSATSSITLYARVTIVCNQCRLKQQKTSLKSKWGITVFNEVLTFSLLDSNIRECVIAVSVYETIINQKNSKRLIGQAILGKRKAGEDEHWCLMMQSLRQPIAKWHSLLI
ncbi:UNVERIFIED_CONTAM: hypothetical protein FKN15_033317 [Acipenser sinensis]